METGPGYGLAAVGFPWKTNEPQFSPVDRTTGLLGDSLHPIHARDQQYVVLVEPGGGGGGRNNPVFARSDSHANTSYKSTPVFSKYEWEGIRRGIKLNYPIFNLFLFGDLFMEYGKLTYYHVI